MEFNLDQITTVTDLSKKLFDRIITEVNSTMEMDSKIFKDIFLRENSYIDAVQFRCEYKTLLYIMYSSIIYLVFFISLHEAFYKNLSIFYNSFIIIWISIVTIFAIWRICYSYKYFRGFFIRFDVSRFHAINPSFLFVMNNNFIDFCFIVMHTIVHIIPAFIIFHLTHYYNVLLASLDNFEQKTQVISIQDILKKTLEDLDHIHGLRVLAEIGYCLIVFVMFFIELRICVKQRHSKKVISKITINDSGVSFPNTIAPDGISIVKIDGSIVQIDASKDLLRFLNGTIFITTMETGKMKSGIAQDEIKKIVIDGDNVHEEIVFDLVLQHWHS